MENGIMSFIPLTSCKCYLLTLPKLSRALVCRVPMVVTAQDGLDSCVINDFSGCAVNIRRNFAASRRLGIVFQCDAWQRSPLDVNIWKPRRRQNGFSRAGLVACVFLMVAS